MREKLPVAQRLIYGKLLSEDSKCYDFVVAANVRKSCILAGKRYKDNLEKQTAERTNIENSLTRKAMADKLETVKRKKKETEQVVKELRKSSDTEVLKADEKEDGVARSKVATF